MGEGAKNTSQLRLNTSSLGMIQIKASLVRYILHLFLQTLLENWYASYWQVYTAGYDGSSLLLTHFREFIVFHIYCRHIRTRTNCQNLSLAKELVVCLISTTTSRDLQQFLGKSFNNNIFVHQTNRYKNWLKREKHCLVYKLYFFSNAPEGTKNCSIMSNKN